MPFNRLIALGFVMVLTGAVMPFLIVMRVLPSTFLLNFFAYGISTVGIFLGVIGVAIHVGKERKKSKDDWYDEDR